MASLSLPGTGVMRGCPRPAPSRRCFKFAVHASGREADARDGAAGSASGDRLRGFLSPPLPERVTDAHGTRAESASREADTWERMELLRRQVAIAASEEDYAKAAALRDRRLALQAELSPGTLRMLGLASTLRSAESEADRAAAAAALGRLGDDRAVPSLVTALRDGSRAVAGAAEKACWDVFQVSHDPAADARLKMGVDLMMSPATFGRARDTFGDVIALAPSFAEGYNKRATVLYLMRSYPEAITDCLATVALQPAHFGALSGLGLCYVGLQELDTALLWFRRALDINPNMEQIKSYATRLEQILAAGGGGRGGAETDAGGGGGGGKTEGLGGGADGQ